MLASVLQEAGYKIGLYNSPHLIDFTERIKVNGKNCDKKFVFDFIQKLKIFPKILNLPFLNLLPLWLSNIFISRM
jgi:dihydrofolate synthase/folylpolyglutamate synthase